jgi:hypothetical protein
MAIMLDHQYTKLALSHSGVNALKGVDHDRFNLLKSANENIDKRYKLEFFICHAKMEVEEYDEYYKEEGHENRRFNKIKTWWDCNGAEAFEFFNEDMKVFDLVLNPTTEGKTSVNYRKSKYWNEVRKDDIGYTGNESQGITTIYNKCLLVGFSKSIIKDFKFNSLMLRYDVGDAIQELLILATNDKLLDEAMIAKGDYEFMQKLNLVFNKMANQAYLTGSSCKPMIQILDKIGDITLILKFIDTVMIKMDESSDLIAYWLIKYGFENLMPSLKKIIRTDNLKKNVHITMVNLKN